MKLNFETCGSSFGIVDGNRKIRTQTLPLVAIIPKLQPVHGDVDEQPQKSSLGSYAESKLRCSYETNGMGGRPSANHRAISSGKKNRSHTGHTVGHSQTFPSQRSDAILVHSFRPRVSVYSHEIRGRPELVSVSPSDPLDCTTPILLSGGIAHWECINTEVPKIYFKKVYCSLYPFHPYLR